MRIRGRSEHNSMGIFTPGNVLLVKSVNHRHRAGKMLIDMGITPDTTFTIEKVAPLGEPFVIRVRNYQLALRKEALRALEVELAR